MTLPPVESDFDSYVRASGSRLKRLAFLLTGDFDTAEDLLQSAYAKVLPRWRQVSAYDNPDAYMRRVMVSIRTSRWRRLRGREVLTGEPHDRTGDIQGGVGRPPAATSPLIKGSSTVSCERCAHCRAASRSPWSCGTTAT
jgi:DNA-directed RNA polymerase specialized sigma24 family protein